ncbi:protein phosphatase 2C-like protein [Lentzea atacamensis]|uniref:Protein phosphatase 2C-like protein n=1 Tax=Lentzea atacamensis TaxID=531938 RepID=A0ABX9DUZ8_9PSEU|nr:protein phosphatase 2C domain-containing protein [Lentzea atacamensis]RAS57824.1 protein phosphatase 2C-like protein [Lentzea atacamensis]
MFTTGFTSPGSPAKANEDWFATTPDLAVVLDGATVRTTTGCQHGVPWYVSHLGPYLVAGALDKDAPLRNVLAQAIQQVSNLHADTCDLNDPGTPSAAVGMVRLVDGVVQYLVLGDISLVVETEKDGEYPIEVLRDDRVSSTAAAERAEADRHPIGSAEKDSALLLMKPAELAARNVEGGYFIAAADPAAVEHAYVGSFPVREVVRLALLSDGAARLVETFGLLSWTRALNMIEFEGPAAAIARVRDAEAGDPVGEAHPRNKTSDDATVLFADFHKVPSRVVGLRVGRAVNFDVDFDDPEVKAVRSKTLADFHTQTHDPDLTGEDVGGWRRRRDTNQQV